MFNSSKCSLKELEMTQDTPRPSSHHLGDLFAPEGQRTRNKRQRQETEDEGEGKVYLSWWDKGLPLDGRRQS